MPFVVTRPKTIWQPPRGAIPRIDRGNPFSAGLIGAFVPGVPINIADGVGLNEISTTPAYGGRAGGLTITSSAVGYPAPSASSSREAKFDRSVFSALAICTQDAAENNGVAFFRGNGSGGAAWGVGVHGGSANGPFVWCGSYTGAPAVDLGTGWTRSVRTVLLVADGSTAFVYADGQFITSSSYTAPTYEYDPANWRRVIFGARNWVLTNLQSRAFLGLFWNRPLPRGEALEISTPSRAWQVLGSQERRVFYSAATGGGFQPSWARGATSIAGVANA